MLFVRLCSLIKDKILVVYPSTYAGDSAPPILPRDSNEFLSISCAMDSRLVDQCWSLLKNDIWSGVFAFLEDVESVFLVNGVGRGFREFLCVFLVIDKLLKGLEASSHSLYPPTRVCINPMCRYVCEGKPVKLQGAEERNVILYTITRGPAAVQSTHITCNGLLYFSFVY